MGYLSHETAPGRTVPEAGPSLVPSPPQAATGRASSAEEVVVGVLEPDEHVRLFVECMRRQRIHTFEHAVLAVTDRRLLVIGPAFPWGHQLQASHELRDCRVVNGKERLDGSRLLVIHHDAGNLCLYFGRRQREEAEAIVDAVGLAPNPLSEGALPPQAAAAQDSAPQLEVVPTEIDRFAMAQELSGLLEPEDEDEDL
jgi:hypothetical protein